MSGRHRCAAQVARSPATMAGNATGLLVWSTAAAVGLSAVLLADRHASLAVRLVGGAVLPVLGINTLRAAAKRPAGAGAGAPTPVSMPVRVRVRRLRAVPDYGARTARAGLATTLGNPKAGVLAVAGAV
ncbi:LysE family transporter [Streptomyces humi]|uniref:LysE family transporter n=1 Tax=Streptomyces humi TaxID=1428620 RepID=UPI001160CD39|nr:LysE family transporter [Streptomyces humi]